MKKFKTKYKEYAGTCYVIHPEDFTIKEDIIFLLIYMTPLLWKQKQLISFPSANGSEADVWRCFCENRIKILKLLSSGELCACKILEDLSITQPTLSHYMKILSDCNLVKSRKDGKWSHYSLNYSELKEVKDFISELKNKNSKKRLFL